MLTNIITATITGFCACKTCCGPNAKGICANNKRPIQGITVAASRTIPFGSKVTMPSSILRSCPIQRNNNFIVQDRMHRRYDKEYRFDIYFAKHSDAKQFGIKTNQTVTIITTK